MTVWGLRGCFDAGVYDLEGWSGRGLIRRWWTAAQVYRQAMKDGELEPYAALGAVRVASSAFAVAALVVSGWLMRGEPVAPSPAPQRLSIAPLVGVEDWSREDVAEWAQLHRGGNDAQLAVIFTLATAYDVREVIPLAILRSTGDTLHQDGTVRTGAVAAHVFLGQYTQRQIESAIEAQDEPGSYRRALRSHLEWRSRNR